jgi:hypothetical protein
MSRLIRTRPRGPGFVAWLGVLAILLSACAGSGGSTSPATSSASHKPAPSGFPMLGGWTTTVTKDEIAARGFADPGIQNENSGTFTWVFEADGTWRSVQASLDGSPIRNPVFSGWYTVNGSTLTLVTDFPEAYRDDGIDYAFTVEADAVRMQVLNPPDDVMPIVFESHPWIRTQP